MTTPTPGPWQVLPPLGEGDYSVHSERVTAYGNCYVAVIPNCPHAEAEANARLIAAAPELLKAVQIAYACLRRADTERDENRVVNILLSAIAKAEGE